MDSNYIPPDEVKYPIMIDKTPIDYDALIVDFHGIECQGKTAQECEANAAAAINSKLAELIDNDLPMVFPSIGTNEALYISPDRLIRSEISRMTIPKGPLGKKGNILG